MPREAGMMKISSSQLAMQHLSPCNSSVKKAAEGGGGGAGRDCFYMAEIEGNHCFPPFLFLDLNLVSGLKLSLCFCGHKPYRFSF